MPRSSRSLITHELRKTKLQKINQKPKRKLAGASPPKRVAKRGKNSEVDCNVCEEPILESGEHCVGDEAVFCEGVYRVGFTESVLV